MMDDTALEAVYRDRNLLALLAAKLADRLGYDVGVKEGDDPEWPLVFVDLPLCGQISYHLPRKELIGGLPEYTGVWDGHTTSMKQARIEAFLENRDVKVPDEHKAIDEVTDPPPPVDQEAPPTTVEQTGRFALQLHVRGTSAHADWRFERPGEERPVHSWATQASRGELEAPVRTVEMLKALAAQRDMWLLDWDAGAINKDVKEIFSHPANRPLPAVWLDVEGELKVPDPADPPLPAVSQLEHGVIAIVDRGEVDWGAQLPDLQEFFIRGRAWQGQLTFRQLGQQRVRSETGWPMAEYAQTSGHYDAPQSHKAASPDASESAGPAGFWTFHHTTDVTPYVLSQAAVEAHWLPPRGHSALPKEIREAVPEGLRYWQMADQRQALAARARLAAGDDVQRAPQERPQQGAAPQGAEKEVTAMIDTQLVHREAWTASYINDLPDSAFLYIEEGGKKDEEGKTVPRALRHFPVRDHNGKLDLPHLRNAIARAPQADLPQAVRERVQERARQLLDEASGKTEKKAFMDHFKEFWAALGEGLSHYIRVEEPPSEPVQTFITHKQADGRYRWVAISSTAYLDRDGEIVSQAALEKAVERQQGQDLGPLNFWHTPIRLGSCDTALQDGLCRVESGLWDDTEVAVKVRQDVEARPDFWGVSVEFEADTRHIKDNQLVRGVLVRRVYEDVEFRGRGLLPKEWSSNPFTSIASLGGMTTMDTKKQELLRGLIGAELADQIAAQVDQLNAKQSDPDAVHKEANDKTPPEKEIPEKKDKAAEKPPTDEDEEEDEDKLPFLPDKKKKEAEAEAATSTLPPEVLEALRTLSDQVTNLQKQLDEVASESAPLATKQVQRPSQSDANVTDKTTEDPATDSTPIAVSAMAAQFMKALGGK